MASIFTGLAFMHGHIVDRELAMRLGRDDALPVGGTGAAAVIAATGKHAVTRVDLSASPGRAGSPCPTC